MRPGSRPSARSGRGDRHRRAATALAALALLVPVACSGDDADADAASPTSTEAEGATSTLGEDAPGTDDGPVVPGEEWVVADPADHGIDEAGLEEAREYAFQDDLHTQGVVVVHEGEIVAEWYEEGADADSPAASWSMAKSFASALVGLAIDDGAIPSVDEPMTTYVPEWEGTPQGAMTVRNVLHMESGLRWNEDYQATRSDIVEMVATSGDHLAFATSRPFEVAPGTRWSYSSGDSMLLSTVIEQATGQPAGEYARERIFEPLGMGSAEWWSDPAGNTLTYCCLDATSRDYARFGLLYLRGGAWGDEQVVPEAWVEESLEPSAHQEGYGYQWWLDDPGAGDAVPDDLFMAQGFDGQWIYVVPSLDLVVVRNSSYARSEGPAVADPTLFARYPPGGIIPGEGTRPPERPWEVAELLGPIVAALDA